MSYEEQIFRRGDNAFDLVYENNVENKDEINKDKEFLQYTMREFLTSPLSEIADEIVCEILHNLPKLEDKKPPSVLSDHNIAEEHGRGNYL